MKKAIPFLAATLCCCPLLALTTSRAAAALPMATISPAQRQAEIVGAKAAVQRLQSVKILAQLGPCLTNRSAGFFALLTGGILASVASMADSFTQQAPHSSPADAAKLRELKVFEQRYKAILAKYDFPKSGDPSEKQLALHGRAFYADVTQLLASLPDSHTSPKQDVASFNGPITYQVVSPTRVRIIDGSDMKHPTFACLEDGQWRIDMIPPGSGL